MRTGPESVYDKWNIYNIHVESNLYSRSNDNPYFGVFMPRLYPDYLMHSSSSFGLEEDGGTNFAYGMLS
jgi:hypothetical protein